jgi:hypothetical protein
MIFFEATEEGAFEGRFVAGETGEVFGVVEPTGRGNRPESMGLFHTPKTSLGGEKARLPVTPILRRCRRNFRGIGGVGEVGGSLVESNGKFGKSGSGLSLF